MAVRSLQQILGELGSVYEPQVEQYRQRQALIPGQIAEEEKGLQAKQENAFGEILGGARRRGLGFSGIPLSEQAKYTSTEFLPALARLKQSGREQAMSLEDAILGIQERRNQAGQQIYQSEISQDLAERQFQESIRQFNEQMRAQAEERARQAAAARASAYSPTYGGGGSAPSGGKAPSIQDQAYVSVQRFLQGNDASIRSDYAATLASANKGNAMDKLKIQLYQQSRPDLFKPAASAPIKGLGQAPYFSPPIFNTGPKSLGILGR